MPRSGSAQLVAVTRPTVTFSITGPTAVPVYSGGSPPADANVAVLPRGSATLAPAAGAALYDAVPYTIQVASPRRLTLNLGGRPLDMAWVGFHEVEVGTVSHTFTQVGWADFSVPEENLTVRVRVHSRKLDYETDYRDMVQDLEQQVRGLSARLLSRTVDALRSTDESSDVWAFWVAVLKELWRYLGHDIQVAWNTLPLHLEPGEQVTSLGRLRRPRLADVRAWARTGHERIGARPRLWDPLSPERLYLLQLLAHLVRRLGRLFLEQPELQTRSDLMTIEKEASDLLRALSVKGQVDRVVGEPRIPRTPRAQSHPALRRVTFWHQELNRGLFPDAGHYFVGMKDIHKLYEYWCYLTIIRVLVEESGGVLRVDPKAARSPTNVILSTGRRTAVVELSGGHAIHVHYEPRYRQLPTVAQQPDHVVELQGRETTLLFDAKYRFEADPDNVQAYGAGMPIPPVDTINTMHQYRDAIVTGASPPQRRVRRAVVIYPLPAPLQDEWDQHRFHRSIASVGVGAIPLTPRGTDRYLREQIRGYLACDLGGDLYRPSPGGHG